MIQRKATENWARSVQRMDNFRVADGASGAIKTSTGVTSNDDCFEKVENSEDDRKKFENEILQLKQDRDRYKFGYKAVANHNRALVKEKLQKHTETTNLQRRLDFQVQKCSDIERNYNSLQDNCNKLLFLLQTIPVSPDRALVAKYEKLHEDYDRLCNEKVILLDKVSSLSNQLANLATSQALPMRTGKHSDDKQNNTHLPLCTNELQECRWSMKPNKKKYCRQGVSRPCSQYDNMEKWVDEGKQATSITATDIDMETFPRCQKTNKQFPISRWFWKLKNNKTVSGINENK